MKLFVRPDYYSENREELMDLVKDEGDIIILSNKSTLIPYSMPGYMLVSNKQMEEYYHHCNLIENLNMSQPVNVVHGEDGSVEYMQKRFTIPPLNYEINKETFNNYKPKFNLLKGDL